MSEREEEFEKCKRKKALLVHFIPVDMHNLKKTKSELPCFLKSLQKSVNFFKKHICPEVSFF